MSGAGRIRCTVAYATRDRQWQWQVDLAEGATLADALEAARIQSELEEIPWYGGPVGIFGQRLPREARLKDGDRVEIYRSLTADARERRRQRARHF